MTAGIVFARRLREVRERKRWTQQRLADELDRLGLRSPAANSISRVTLAKIEAGGEEHTSGKNRTRAKNVSLEEVLALSAALGVAPVHMIATPDEGSEDAYLQVAPRLELEPDRARRWIRGEEPLRATDKQFFEGQVSADEWERWRNGAYRATEDLRAVLGHLLSGTASEPTEILLRDIDGFAKDVLREVQRFVRAERANAESRGAS